MRSELNKVKITEHEQDVLSIIGKYNHETPIKQRTNPAIIKLLQFYKMDAAKVYNDYSLLKKSQSIDVSARLGLAKRNLKNITVTELEWIFNLNEEIN